MKLLYFSNKLTDKGAEILSASLEKLKGLRNINLNIIKLIYFSNILHNISQHNEILIKLKYNSTEISEKGAIFLTESMSKIPGLSKLALNLKGIELKDAGAQLLGTALKKLESLKTLSLDIA